MKKRMLAEIYVDGDGARIEVYVPKSITVDIRYDHGKHFVDKKITLIVDETEQYLASAIKYMENTLKERTNKIIFYNVNNVIRFSNSRFSSIPFEGLKELKIKEKMQIYVVGDDLIMSGSRHFFPKKISDLEEYTKFVSRYYGKDIVDGVMEYLLDYGEQLDNFLRKIYKELGLNWRIEYIDIIEKISVIPRYEEEIIEGAKKVEPRGWVDYMLWTLLNKEWVDKLMDINAVKVLERIIFD